MGEFYERQTALTSPPKFRNPPYCNCRQAYNYRHRVFRYGRHVGSYALPESDVQQPTHMRLKSFLQESMSVGPPTTNSPLWSSRSALCTTRVSCSHPSTSFLHKPHYSCLPIRSLHRAYTERVSLTSPPTSPRAAATEEKISSFLDPRQRHATSHQKADSYVTKFIRFR
jgi:hypothetical protein